MGRDLLFPHPTNDSNLSPPSPFVTPTEAKRSEGICSSPSCTLKYAGKLPIHLQDCAVNSLMIIRVFPARGQQCTSQSQFLRVCSSWQLLSRPHHRRKTSTLQTVF